MKSSHTNVELLKEKILEEQGRRERAEMELSKLQEIEAKAQKLELELASCTALLSNIPDVSSFGDIPQKIADLQKCVSIVTISISFVCYRRALSIICASFFLYVRFIWLF